MTAEKYEQATGSLTNRLREQNNKIIRDRLDFEYLFMKAEEDKKENEYIQARNKQKEEEKNKLLEKEKIELLERNQLLE